jgi:hypothetical protein
LSCDVSIVTYYIVTVYEDDTLAVGRCTFSLFGLQQLVMNEIELRSTDAARFAYNAEMFTLILMNGSK